MSAFDLPLDQLREYRPERTSRPISMRSGAGRSPTPAPLGGPPRVRAGRVAAPHGRRLRRHVRGLRRPADPGLAPRAGRCDRSVARVVEYIGYGGGRSFPLIWLTWASAGYAHLVMDTRGQGSSWSPGDTPDIEPDAGERAVPRLHDARHRRPARPTTTAGCMTDAVRAIDAAAAHPPSTRTASRSPAEPGRRPRARRRGPGAAGRGRGHRCPVPVPLAPRHRDHRRASLPRDRATTSRPSATARSRIHHAGYFDGMNFAAHATPRRCSRSA